jgi:integrase
VKNASCLPDCFSRPVSEYAIYLNDFMMHRVRNELLMPFVTLLPGTSDALSIEAERARFIVVETVRRIVAAEYDEIWRKQKLAATCRAVRSFERVSLPMAKAQAVLPLECAKQALKGFRHLHPDLCVGPPCAAAAQAAARSFRTKFGPGAEARLALKLTIADVTSDGLLIRETKFRKTRRVPLHDTAVAGLQRYLDRRGPGSDDDPVFIDKRGRPLRYIAVKETFDRLVDKAGIKSRLGRRPRLHDLRHTFAVRALQGSPAGRGRCGAHMAALATYMGHVNIYATYWYLEATADFLRDVATAGEAFISEGRSA